MKSEIVILFIIYPFLLFFAIPILKAKNNTKKRKLMIVLFAFMYIFTIGLRDSGGADDQSYRWYYESKAGGSIFQLFVGKEPSFNLIRNIGYWLNFNYKFLFLSYSIITSIFLGLGLNNYMKEYAEDKKTSMISSYMLGFYFIVFLAVLTTMRQALAMSMLFYMYSAKDLKLIKKIILWTLIICVHYGFVLILPLEIILNKKKYKLSQYTMTGIPIICLAISQLNFERIIYKVTSYIGLYTYLNDTKNYEQTGQIGIVAITLLIMYLYKMIRYKELAKQENTSIDMLNRITCGQMIYLSLIFLTMNMRWSNRIGYYYLMFMPFLIDEFCYLLPFNDRSKKTIRACMLIFLYIASVYATYKSIQISGYQWSMNFR